MNATHPKKKSRNPLGLRLFLKNGAEGEIRNENVNI
jgi:hypothetical protein